MPLSLLAVAACLALLPPTRATELADSLCEAELGLLDAIRWALGPLAAGVRTGGAAPATRRAAAQDGAQYGAQYGAIAPWRAAAPAAAAPLGTAEGTGSDTSGELPLGTSPRALAASLRLLTALLRYDGAPRRQAYIEMPILGRPAALASLLRHADLRAVPSVQAAGCALVRVLLTNAGSGGGGAGGGGAGGGGGLRRSVSEGGSCDGVSSRPISEASSALDEYFEAALAALVAHGHESRSAAALEIACDASEVLGLFVMTSLIACKCSPRRHPSPQVLGVFAARQAGALHHKGALVIGAVVGALQAHGRTSTEAARAGCYALRALCLARNDQGNQRARMAARQRLDELRSMEGARHLKATLDAQGHKLPRPLRSSCVELLQDMGAK